MATTKIKQAFFLHGGIRYFRTRAENIELGNYGEKQVPATKPNFLAVYDRLDPAAMAKARVRVGKSTKIDWKKVTKVEVGVPKLKYLTVDGGKVNFSLQVADQAKLELVKFSIDFGPLCKVVNSDAAALAYLKDKGPKRLVCDIWVVVEAKLSEKFGSQATMKVAAAKKDAIDLEVTAAFEGDSKSIVTLSKDTTFAYLLAKPAEWNDATGELMDLKPDQQGLA